jgi:hypothetical protein
MQHWCINFAATSARRAAEAVDLDFGRNRFSGYTSVVALDDPRSGAVAERDHWRRILEPRIRVLRIMWSSYRWCAHEFASSVVNNERNRQWSKWTAQLPRPSWNSSIATSKGTISPRSELSTTLESEANLTGENGATGFGSSLPVLGF